MGKVRLKVCRTRKMETVPKNGIVLIGAHESWVIIILGQRTC